jgi:hypothetical protein
VIDLFRHQGFVVITQLALPVFVFAHGHRFCWVIGAFVAVPAHAAGDVLALHSEAILNSLPAGVAKRLLWMGYSCSIIKN